MKDYRPQLERVSPNIENGNFLLRKVIEEVLREFKNAEKNDKNRGCTGEFSRADKKSFGST